MKKDLLQLLITARLLQPDGSAGGGDPLAINPDEVGRLFSERILGINPKDTPEDNPRDPDNPRYNNFPLVDDSPINYKGHKSLRSLGLATAKMLSDQHEANKAAGKPTPAVFLRASVETDNEIISLRLYGFGGLNPNPVQGTESYIAAGITRRTRVRNRGGGTVSYGRVVGTVAAPEKEVQQQTQTTAQPATQATAGKPAVV